MMRNTTIRSIAFAAGIALLALAAPAPRVLAATWYWNTNTTGLWTTTSNWSDNPSTGGSNPSTAPTTGDTAYFNQSSKNGATTLRLSADQSIDGLVFANTGATTITGTASNRILTIGTVGITINSGAGAVTLGNATSGSQVAIAMGGSQTWTNNSSNTLTATNGITSTSGTQTLTIGGSGATAVGGIIADGAAGNRVSITKEGAGNLTLSAANTFTGPVTINSGTLTVTSAIGNGGVAGSLGQSTSDAANLVINGGVLNWNTASAETTNRGITIGTNGGTILSNNNGNNGLTLTGSLALAGSGARTITLTSVANNRSNSWSADIGDSGGATAVIVNNTMAGGSSWALSGNLTFTGGLSVGGGGGGVLDLTGTRNNFSGGVTVGAGSALNLTAASTTSFSPDVTNNGGFNVNSSNNTGSVHTISGLISGSGSVGNTLSQNGVVFLSNANNSYTGRTWMSGNAAETTVRVSKLANGGQNSGIGASTSAAANLEIGGNTGTSYLQYVGAGDSTDRLFTIRGNGGFRAGILNDGSGPLSFTNTGTIPFVTANTINTFILGGANTGNNTFAPVVTDNGTARVSFTKGGAGTWVLTGNNTFSGATTIGAGSLGVATVGNAGGTSNLGASGTINFGATTTTGTLVYTGAGETSDKVINLAGTTGGAGIQADNASGTLIFSNNLTVTGSGAKTLTLSGSGAGQLQGIIPNYTGAGGPLAVSVTKSGNGTWRLSGANSYTGATTVSAGVLRLDAANALPGGIASTGGSSALTINGGVIGLGNGDFTRGLGTGTNQVQITGGGGFAAYGADRTVNLGGNGTPTSLTWGTGSFITTAGGTFVLGATDATNMVDFQNPIALGAAVRTVQVNRGSGAVDARLSGVLSGNASSHLTKTGAGVLELTAVNTYSGTTAINAGRFLVSSAGNLSNTARVVVDGSGADFRWNSSTAFTRPLTMTQGTISGTGTISASGGVSIGTNAILSPGNSPGIQAYTSGLTFASGGQYTWEINNWAGAAGTAYDQIAVSGSPLSITANSGSPFKILITSLTSSDAAGAVPGFSPGTTGTTFTIATSAAGITGFDRSNFAVDWTTAFGNVNTVPTNAGFWLSTNTGSTELLLNYAPSATYTLSAAASASAIRVGGTSTITATITSSTAAVTNPDRLGYTGLALSGSGGLGALSSTTGTIAPGGSGSGNAAFTSLTSGSYTFTPQISTASNVNLGTPATAGSTSGVSVTVWNPAVATTSGSVNLGTVIVGSTSAWTQALSITNSAPTGDFSEGLNASFGSLSGVTTNSGSFSLLPAGSTNNTALAVALATGSVGNLSGAAQINFATDGQSTSGLAAAALDPQTVNVYGTVLDHALPGFLASGITNAYADDVLNISFGSIDESAGAQFFTYSLLNLASQTYGAALTAGLDFTGVTADGNGFASGLSTFNNLLAGGTSSQFTLSFTPTGQGTFSKQFTLSFSDNRNLAGASATRDLTINAQVIVVPEPGTIALAGIGIAAAAWALRRRK